MRRHVMPETYLITRCPACDTAFRASETQLSTREGQVRCGRCETVFDALAHALPDDTGIDGSGRNAPPPSDETFDSPDTQADDAVEAVEELQQNARPAVPDALVLTPPPSEALPHEIETEAAPPVQIDTADPNLEFDFGRPKQAPGIGRRLFSLFAIGLLLGVLALQVTFHFRGDIALLFPDTKSALEAFCASAGCSLPLPQRADMMSIESSDLQADTLNPGVMVLSAMLRNRAPFAQTPPSLELTLTDAQDQPLARRVLTVADYLPRGSAAGAVAMAETTFPSGSELPVRVYFDASAVQPTGYRLYLFYP